MGVEYGQRFCTYCNDYVLSVRNTPNHILHLLLAIATGGLWIIIWIFMSKSQWRCTACGSSSTKMFVVKDSSEIGRQNHTRTAPRMHREFRSYGLWRPIALAIISFFPTALLLLTLYFHLIRGENVGAKPYLVLIGISLLFWTLTFLSFVAWKNNRPSR